MTDISNNDHFNDMITKFDEIMTLLSLDNNNSIEFKKEWCDNFTNKIIKDEKIFKKFKKRVKDVFEHIERDEISNKLMEKIKLIEKNNIIWDNLHLIVLLNTILHDGDKHISKQLFKSIEKHQYDNEMVDKSKSIVKKKQNGNVIDNLLGDLKTKLNSKDSFNISDIFSLTKDLSADYHEKMTRGEFNINDIFTGMMNLVNDPSKIENEFKGFDDKLKGTPEEFIKSVQDDPKLKEINNMVNDTFKDGKFDPNSMIDNLSKNMGLDGDGLKKGFDTMKNVMSTILPTGENKTETNPGMNLLGNLVGGEGGLNPLNMISGLINPEKELTKEEIKDKQKELEEFYSKLEV